MLNQLNNIFFGIFGKIVFPVSFYLWFYLLNVQKSLSFTIVIFKKSALYNGNVVFRKCAGFDDFHLIDY